MRRLSKITTLLAWIMLVPALAYGQASITGTVKDASGAVLPGVTVEASSPVLIEKVRTAVTDGTGQYRIVDLRPGTYTVTFTLTGFNTLKREGIELTGAFTATVNADLRVGALEETITVTGESPIVDIQSVRRQVTLSGEVIQELPAARAYAAIFTLVPAVTVAAGTNTDVQVMPGMVVFGGAGGRNNEGRIQVDGLNIGAALNGGGVSSYVADVGNAQEISFTTSGGLGEAEVGGPSLSIVPKTGGNVVRGSLYLASVRDWMVGSNYTQKLKDAGLPVPGNLIKLWDYNLGIGGPILKDRLWYFANARTEGSYRSVPGMFANLNAGDPTKFTYVPDLGRQAVQAGRWNTASVRLTAQPTVKHKFNVFWDEQKPCLGGTWSPQDDGCRKPDPDFVFAGATGASAPGGNATSAPEVATFSGKSPGKGGAWQRVQQATWTATMTSRLLLEAGVGTYHSRWGGQEIPGNPTRGLVRIVEQCTAGCLANAGIQGLTYRSQNWSSNVMQANTWRASASYVTGAHSTKVGYQGALHIDDQKNFTNDLNLQYRVNNGIPNQLTQNLNPFQIRQRVRYHSFYGQEQWTFDRVTLQGALRYDHAWSYFPEQQVGPTRFLTTPIVFPQSDGVKGYDDISPRVGVAWDLFGNGKTSVKANVGKYLEAAANGGGTNYSTGNPTARLSTQITRSWTDANGNFVPDCDLMNPGAQDLRAAGGDSCGAMSNLNFGKNIFSDTLAADIVEGWGLRPNDWQIGVSVQQELFPRVSIEVGYFRRWLNNFSVTDNLNTAASNWDSFSIRAPSDPRLPNGGGYTISGLYDVSPVLFGSTGNLITLAENYGKQSSVFNGLLFDIKVRPRNGLTIQGGIGTGKTVTDNCEIRAQLPEQTAGGARTPTSLHPANPNCHVDSGFLTRATALGSYLIPKVDVLVSGTFRSEQGQQLAAFYNVTSAVAAQSLGRPLSGNAPNVTVNLIEPGTLYGDRANELDLRVGKILKWGRTRTNVGVDIYNVLNAAPVLNYNLNFIPGGTWLRPNQVLTARFVKISATIDF